MKDKPLLMDKLREIRDQHDQARSKILRNWDIFGKIYQLGQQFEASGTDRSADVDIYSWGCISMRLYLARDDSFKAADFVLAAVLDMGWQPDGGSDAGTTRDFHFKNDLMNFYVYVCPDFRSQKCKRVKVGVEEIERFKLVCDDEPAEKDAHETTGTPT